MNRRKKLSIFSFFTFVLFFANSSFAQKIYLIAEGDFDAANVEQCVSASVGLIRASFKMSLPDNRLVLYNDFENDAWTGPDVSNSQQKRRDLLNAIARCPVGSDDAIVCYWCGHGAFDEKGHYFDVSGDPIRRSDVRKALEAKGARFTALISESCHVYSEASDERGPQAPVGGASPQDVPKNFQSLFFRSKGTLDINSSSPGETARADPTNGGAFTFAFNVILTSEQNQSLSWNEAIKQIDKLVEKIFQHRQNVYAWSTPSGGSNVPETRPNDWSEARFHPENGDRIIGVNENAVDDFDDFRTAVANSLSVMIITLLDKRTGNKYYLKTNLWPKGSSTRLGIYVGNDGGEGVVVTGVWADSPGNRCQYLKNGDVQAVFGGSY